MLIGTAPDGHRALQNMWVVTVETTRAMAPETALFGRFGLIALLVITIVLVFRQREGRCACPGLLRNGWLLAIAIGRLRGLLRLPLRLLGLRRRHDAVIVLGVLQVILSHHPVARGIGIPRKLQVFFIDMRGRAANFDFGSARIIRAIGVKPTTAAATPATAAAVTTVMTVLRPTTASA